MMLFEFSLIISLFAFVIFAMTIRDIGSRCADASDAVVVAIKTTELLGSFVVGALEVVRPTVLSRDRTCSALLRGTTVCRGYNANLCALWVIMQTA